MLIGKMSLNLMEFGGWQWFWLLAGLALLAASVYRWLLQAIVGVPVGDFPDWERVVMLGGPMYAPILALLATSL